MVYSILFRAQILFYTSLVTRFYYNYKWDVSFVVIIVMVKEFMCEKHFSLGTNLLKVRDKIVLDILTSIIKSMKNLI